MANSIASIAEQGASQQTKHDLKEITLTKAWVYIHPSHKVKENGKIVEKPTRLSLQQRNNNNVEFFAVLYPELIRRIVEISGYGKVAKTKTGKPVVYGARPVAIRAKVDGDIIRSITSVSPVAMSPKVDKELDAELKAYIKLYKKEAK